MSLAKNLQEPPSSPAAALVERAGRLLLIAILVAPVAVFPLGLACKLYSQYASGAAPTTQVATNIAPN